MTEVAQLDEHKKVRLIGLDFFRIMAMLSVFLFHAGSTLGIEYGIMTDFFSMGAVFMTGFFMLSGYVLYCVYHKCNLYVLINIKGFYIKRLVALMPAYWIVALLYLLLIGSESWKENLMLAPIEATGMQATFSTIRGISHNGTTWFVSCMVICYILYPFFQEIIKQLTEKTKRFFVGVCVMLLFLSPFIVWYYDILSTYASPFYRCLEFLLGILISSSVNRPSGSEKKGFFFTRTAALIEIVVLLLGVSAAVRLHIAEGNYMLYNWIVLPVFMLMMLSFGNQKSKTFRGNKVLAYLSNISYEFYLVQMFVWPTVQMICQSTGIQSDAFKLIAAFLACTGFAVILHTFVSKPVARLFQKYNLK